MTRRLADALAAATDTAAVRLAPAQVTGIAGPQVTLTLDGATLTVPVLASYTPVVGDVVLVLCAAGGRVVLGRPAT